MVFVSGLLSGSVFLTRARALSLALVFAVSLLLLLLLLLVRSLALSWSFGFPSFWEGQAVASLCSRSSIVPSALAASMRLALYSRKIVASRLRRRV